MSLHYNVIYLLWHCYPRSLNMPDLRKFDTEVN